MSIKETLTTAKQMPCAILGTPIDFICVNEQISNVKTYKIIRDTYDGKFVSDHYPICSDMIF